MRWFANNGTTGDVLSIQERKTPGEKQDLEGILITMILSQVDFIYKMSDKMSLSDALEAEQIAPLEDQGDDNDVLVLTVMSMKTSVWRGWHGLSMTCNNPFIEVLLL